MKNEDSVGIAVWRMPSTISPCLLGTINIEICSDLDCRCKCPHSYRNNSNAKDVRIVSWECFKDCKKRKKPRTPDWTSPKLLPHHGERAIFNNQKSC